MLSFVLPHGKRAFLSPSANENTALTSFYWCPHKRDID